MVFRKKEGFPNQRLVVVSANVIARCQSMPLVKRLYVTDIGSYPVAPFHYVDRPEGVAQAIMICCQSGRGNLKLESGEFAIRTGDLFVIPPHATHTYWADAKEPWSLFWVHFGGTDIAPVIETLGISNQDPVIFISDIDLLKSAFEELYACLNYHYSDIGLLSLTTELQRFCCTIKKCEGHIEYKRRSTEKRVLDTIGFMESHTNLILTLKQLANHSGQSVSYYSRVFKEKTGQSPLNYFTQIKISKACQLLDQTDLTINQIAKKLGYSDPYYFSRLFKKIQGVAPAFYRKSIKG